MRFFIRTAIVVTNIRVDHKFVLINERIANAFLVEKHFLGELWKIFIVHIVGVEENYSYQLGIWRFSVFLMVVSKLGIQFGDQKTLLFAGMAHTVWEDLFDRLDEAVFEIIYVRISWIVVLLPILIGNSVHIAGINTASMEMAPVVVTVLIDLGFLAYELVDMFLVLW